MSRPSKLSEERREKIASLIRAGNYSSQAAQASGISERTFFRWMEQGAECAERCEDWAEQVEDWNELSDNEKRAQPHLCPNEEQQPTEEEYELWQFWQAVKKAEAEAEAAAVLHIKKAASDGTWQAAAWYLERKYKDRWSRQDKVSHEGSVSHDHSHRLLSASPEQIEEAKRRLEAARSLENGNQGPATIDAEVVEEDE